MEFQSTEKSLDNVLSLNQGMSNAYTSTENTNYYFNVAPTALNETLEVFANMFSIPKFQQQNVERESSAGILIIYIFIACIPYKFNTNYS